MIQNSEQTSLSSYRLVFTGDGTDTAPTEFPLGITDGEIDLHDAAWGGKGTETKANRLCMIILADQAGSGTLAVTGACDGGPEEYIASLVLTVGGTVETGTNRWVETIALTSYHIAEDSILVADNADNHVSKFGFDAAGYRYINFYSSAFTNVTWVKVYVRYF